MRISDWSSDVCSSDLGGYHLGWPAQSSSWYESMVALKISIFPDGVVKGCFSGSLLKSLSMTTGVGFLSCCKSTRPSCLNAWKAGRFIRSEERRVGKECVIRVDLGGRRSIKKKIKKNDK